MRRLRDLTQIKLNLEMAATDEMVGIACGSSPRWRCSCPEGRHEVTTEGGLDIVSQEARLKSAVARLADVGIIVSVFIDAEIAQVEAAAHRCQGLRDPHRALPTPSMPPAAMPKARP